MELIFSLLTGSGLFGGLMGFVQTFFESRKQKQEFAQRIELAKLDHDNNMAELRVEAELGLQKIELESQAKQAIAQLASEQAIAEADAQSLQKSYQHDASIGKGASQWVINGRAATRFLMTWFVVLAAVGTGIYLCVTADDPKSIYLTLESFAATAFGWWFSRRTKRSPIERNL